MKPKDKKKTPPIRKLQCRKCGHEYTQLEYHLQSNLCSHLVLDAAPTQGEPESTGGSTRKVDLNPIQPSTIPQCLRCQGLMMRERFFDWGGNEDFEGWRCVSCGNVWDGVIAEHQSFPSANEVHESSARTTRPMAIGTAPLPYSHSSDNKIQDPSRRTGLALESTGKPHSSELGHSQSSKIRR